MPDKVVSTAFKGKDVISQTFKGMGKSAKDFEIKTKRSFKRASKSALNFKTLTGGILSANLISRGAALAGRALRGVVDEAINFDSAITAAAAKFPEGIKRGTKEFNELRAAARKTGAETEYTATQSGEALDFLAMAGFNAKQAMAALPGVVDLATASQLDLAQATDISSDALGAFGLMSKDTAQLQTNLARVNDVFAKTVTSANTTVEMMFETMKDAGPVITAAGDSIEDFATFTGKMANAGIKGSKAGTTLKNMYLKLAKPMDDAKKIMAEHDITVRDSENNLRSMIDVLADVREATKGMGTAQKAATIETLFGKRAIAGVNVLLAESDKSLRDYKKSLVDSGGAAKAMAEDIRKSLGNRLAALKSAAIEVGLKFFDAFEKKLPGAVDRAIEAVRKFDVKPIVESVKTMVNVISSLVGWVIRMKPVILAAAAAWIFYKAQMKAAMMFDAAAKFMEITRAAQMATGAKGIGGFSRAALNQMGKGGAVTLAVGAVALAVYQIHKNSDSLKSAWNTDFKDWWKGWDSIKGIISEAGDETLRLLGLQQDYNKEIQKVPKEKEPKTRQVKHVVDPTMLRVGQRMAGRKPPGDIRIREAPNKAEMTVREQQVKMDANIRIEGLPEGARAESKSKGAGSVNLELAGENI